MNSLTEEQKKQLLARLEREAIENRKKDRKTITLKKKENKEGKEQNNE